MQPKPVPSPEDAEDRKTPTRRGCAGRKKESMNDRKRAYEHLQTVGNFITNDDTKRTVERVDMVGGKYLAYGPGGYVGFLNFNECMKYVGIH